VGDEGGFWGRDKGQKEYEALPSDGWGCADTKTKKKNCPRALFAEASHHAEELRKEFAMGYRRN